MTKSFSLLAFGLGCAVLFLNPSGCFAEEELELSLAVEQNGAFVKPIDKTIVVKQQPLPFSVVLTNRSAVSLPVYWEAGSGGMTSLSFELTNEFGGIEVVKQRPQPQKSTLTVSSYIASGQSVSKTLLIDHDQWENVPKIELGKMIKYKVRIVYQNDNKKIYSEPYTIILDGR